MTLIKAANTAQLTKDAVVLDFTDLRRQADDILQHARAHAAQLIAQAQHDAAETLQKANTDGHAQGLEAGRAEGLAQGRAEGHAQALTQQTETLQQLTDAWTQSLQHWDEHRRALLTDASQSLLTLALALAARIVKRVPQVDPTVVTDQVEAALAYIARPADAAVHINPDDRPVLTEALPDLIARFQQVRHANLIDDPQIERGGCVIHYGSGQIDAQLNELLDRLTETLLPTDPVSPDTAQPQPTNEEPPAA